jgi:glycosyltransferase involved in cell wall biosynthesis
LKTTIVICSANRPDVLAETVDSIVLRQLKPPQEIIISVFDQLHVAQVTRAHPMVQVVHSKIRGTCAQRNVAARLVQSEYTLFLDDDVELAPDFIESMEQLLAKRLDAVAATGILVVDGAPGDKGLDRQTARTYTETYVRRRDNYEHREGQNLFVRTKMFTEVLFDENLPMYGWLEDLDFATNCLRFGRIIMNTETCFAHLAVPSGRTSGLRFGYSQVINPLYLWRKNGEPKLARIVFDHWLLHIAYNLRRDLIKLPSDRNDRAGRFKGNLIALGHLLRKRVDPTYILKLPAESSAPEAVRAFAGSSGAKGRAPKMSVIICSVGRPEVLHETVQSILRQTFAVDEILIGTPSPQNVIQSTLQLPKVRLLLTSPGLTVQRNGCLSQVLPSSDLIAFLDDDMEFSSTYMSAMVALFAECHDLIASSGNLLYDGGVTKVISRETARSLCQQKETDWQQGNAIRTEPREFAYGCNMVFRAAAIRDIRFDEHLPLYGWLEDSDFSHASTKNRRGPVTNLEAHAVHLGWRGGRIAGQSLGFSQIVNSFYLWRKSRVFSLTHVVVQCWLRCVTGNVLGLISGEQIEDRPGRLKGNILGFLHLLRGDLDPLQASNPGRRKRGVEEPKASPEPALPKHPEDQSRKEISA